MFCMIIIKKSYWHICRACKVRSNHLITCNNFMHFPWHFLLVYFISIIYALNNVNSIVLSSSQKIKIKKLTLYLHYNCYIKLIIQNAKLLKHISNVLIKRQLINIRMNLVSPRSHWCFFLL